MLVYQALRRLTGSVRVTHALDDHLLEEQRADFNYGSDHEGLNIGEAQPPYASPATIGRCIRGPITLDGLDEDAGYPEPEELWHSDEIIGGIHWTRDPAYFRDHVTWLNHSPRETTPRELAVAYLVVSFKHR